MTLTTPLLREHRDPTGKSSRGDSKLSRVAWIPGKEMEYGKWVREGRRIGLLAKGSAWWLGDWLHYGTEKWGERYARAAKITGYDPKTLRNLRYVASRFDLSLRRDNLTWSHHALLASLTPDEQAYWLDRAVSKSFSVEDLRMDLRQLRNRGPGAGHANSRSQPTHSVAHAAMGGNDLLCPKCGYQLDLEGRPLTQPNL